MELPIRSRRSSPRLAGTEEEEKSGDPTTSSMMTTLSIREFIKTASVSGLKPNGVK
jgi:hypothetical protein